MKLYFISSTMEVISDWMYAYFDGEVVSLVEVVEEVVVVE